MVLLQKRDQGGLLAGLWECPTSIVDEAVPPAEAAAELLALARQLAADAAGGCAKASLLANNLKALPVSDVRPCGAPFVHMFSHIHRSVRVFGAKVDLHMAAKACPPPAAAACALTNKHKAQLHSISRLAAAGVPTLTRKVLTNAAAVLGFAL